MGRLLFGIGAALVAMAAFMSDGRGGFTAPHALSVLGVPSFKPTSAQSVGAAVVNAADRVGN